MSQVTAALNELLELIDLDTPKSGPYIEVHGDEHSYEEYESYEDQ